MSHTASVKCSLGARSHLGDFLRVKMEKLANKAANLFHGKRAFVWIAFVLLLAAGAARPVNAIAISGANGTTSVPPMTFDVNDLNNVMLVPLPVPVFSGDVVLLEHPLCGRSFSCFSDVLRFNDNATAPNGVGLVTHYVLFSENNSLTGFPAIPLSPNIQFLPESLSGTTTYIAGNFTYLIHSDSPGTNAVGGQVTPINKLALLAPYIGLASVIAAAASVAVFYRRRSKNNVNS